MLKNFTSAIIYNNYVYYVSTFLLVDLLKRKVEDGRLRGGAGGEYETRKPNCFMYSYSQLLLKFMYGKPCI